jgi:putative spermidine/putrescine transport system permease protein
MALPLIAGLALFYLILPILVVVPLSFSSASYLSFPPPGFSLRWYRNLFARADWLSSAWLSVWVGLAVTVLATTLGTPAAVALVRGRFSGKRLINAVILSPLIVPGIIVAIGIYFFYARLGFVGNPVALVLAHTCHRCRPPAPCIRSSSSRPLPEPCGCRPSRSL